MFHWNEMLAWWLHGCKLPTMAVVFIVTASFKYFQWATTNHVMSYATDWSFIASKERIQYTLKASKSYLSHDM